MRGKVQWVAVIISVNGDHPRLCGEKLHRRKRVFTGDRITPAYAGKRRSKKVESIVQRGSPPPMRGKVTDHFIHYLSIWDHPRLCGEKTKPAK